MEEEEEEAGGSTVVSMRPLPFPVMTQLPALPKEEDGLFKPQRLTQHRQEFSRDGQEFISISMAGFPCALHSPGWLKQRLQEKFFLWQQEGAGAVGEHTPAPLRPQDHLPQLHTLPTLLYLGETTQAAEHICGVTTGLLSPFLVLH